MIVDLMRNDLGRLAETGSVKVEGAFTVEPYARLSHLVSTVRCTTLPEVNLCALLQGTFPPGSITGTPKLAAMEIIERLERHPRGFYTGCVGYIDRSGGVSLAVAIRTAQLAEGVLDYFAGGGIVDASVVSREVDETALKALVFTESCRALAGAE
jgi:anthranilate/para-aminobenzoate synthase component I